MLNFCVLIHSTREWEHKVNNFKIKKSTKNDSLLHPLDIFFIFDLLECLQKTNNSIEVKSKTEIAP